MTVETPTTIRGGTVLGVGIQMLGTLTVSREGAVVQLPRSRKVRALLAYLALAPKPVRRSHLCELLWEVPDDPRGELRWCLSKLRRVLDDAGCQRVQTAGDLVSLALGDCRTDAIEIARVMQADITKLDPAALQSLAALFVGDLLDGLELDRSPQFDAWLGAQRRRFRAYHAAVLERWVQTLPVAAPLSFDALEKWIELAPLDRKAHELLLAALAREGRLREGDEHVEITARLFESEGLDVRPLRNAWLQARKQLTLQAPAATDAFNSSLPTPQTESNSTGTTDASVHGGTIPPPRGTSPHALAADGVAARTSEHADRAALVLQEAGRHALQVAFEAPLQGRAGARHASIAIMPFAEHRVANAKRLGMGGALAHDIITRLAKLRSLAVIAQGSVFALKEKGLGPEDAGRALNVDYVASGSIRREKDSIIVMVELLETRTARIVWAEDFHSRVDDTLQTLDAVGNCIVSAIAAEIELAERNRAMLKPPTSLDAWEAHHRGLWHMYRFNSTDNEYAQRFFRLAVKLDPTFSRAYAGLSFTHFQNAFLFRAPNRQAEIDSAFATAEQGLIVDERDPAAHWAMGRALWLRREHDRCLTELTKTIELSPNFALGHYSLSLVHSQAGDPQLAIESSDLSRHLSPFDPMLFAMLATRAFAHLRLGQYDEAAQWALTATKRPNAHVHILTIAAHCLAAASRLDEARTYTAMIHKSHPDYGFDDFIEAFRFAPDLEALITQQASRIGMR